MTAMRHLALVRHELETALAFRNATAAREPTDSLSRMMLEQNEHEIAGLQQELSEVLATDLEVVFEGGPVTQHSIGVPYFQRILESMQATYRAMRRSLLPAGESLSYRDSTLLLAGTAPGSFRAFLQAPGQLELIGESQADLALFELMTLLEAGTHPDPGPIIEWAATADERALRAMVRLSSTLAAGSGVTTVRFRSAKGVDRRVTVSAEHARRLTAALVGGGSGVEVVVVTGRLEMAQERPMRVRVRAPTEDYTATANDEMVDTIRDLLFSEVQATLSIDMRTSPTTGAPSQRAVLLALGPATN